MPVAFPPPGVGCAVWVLGAVPCLYVAWRHAAVTTRYEMCGTPVDPTGIPIGILPETGATGPHVLVPRWPAQPYEHAPFPHAPSHAPPVSFRADLELIRAVLCVDPATPCSARSTLWGHTQRMRLAWHRAFMTAGAPSPSAGNRTQDKRASLVEVQFAPGTLELCM